MDEKLKAAQAEVDKDPDRFATTPEDELEAALDVHATCVRALSGIEPDIQAQVLESVSRFMHIPVEPSVSDLADLLVQTARAALQAYRASGHQADQQVSDDQGREHIASLIAKLVSRYPLDKQETLQRFLVDLWQECYKPSQAPASSGEPSSGEAPPA